MMNNILYFLKETTIRSAEKRTYKVDTLTNDKPQLLGSKSQCQVNEPK